MVAKALLAVVRVGRAAHGTALQNPTPRAGGPLAVGDGRGGDARLGFLEPAGIVSGGFSGPPFFSRRDELAALKRSCRSHSVTTDSPLALKKCDEARGRHWALKSYSSSTQVVLS